jgi:SAM-dependent methyltransferase
VKSRIPAGARRATRRAIDRGLAGLGYSLAEYEPGFTGELADRTVPLPAEASELRSDHPRLRELTARYSDLDWPVLQHSRWNSEHVEEWVDLKYFRGETSYVWHYRETRRTSELKYFVYLEHLTRRDKPRLLARLEEDGAFGCWSYDYPNRPRSSREMLDSVNELLFLDQHLGALQQPGLRVLDIGAGYGRLAHRFSVAAGDQLVDYCCTDAVPTSTFLCEWYTSYRGVRPPVRVAPVYEVPDLEPGSFDLACNVHSWSECTAAAIAWWTEQLSRLEVPRLFVVPNEPDGFLTLEEDGRRLDYLPLIEAAGYRLKVDEPAIPDAAVRELLRVHDRHYLFERAG